MIKKPQIHDIDPKSAKLLDSALKKIQSIPIENDIHSHLSKNLQAVITILSQEMYLGVDAIIAGMFYRHIQYKYVAVEDIEKLFGTKIKTLATGAARIGKLSKTKMQYQADNFIQLILTIVEDPRSILIMLAEQLDKMRGFVKLPQEIKEDVLNEIFYLYAPIAHRLGLYAIKTELEELWLKHAHYPIFRKIADLLVAKKKEREEFIISFIAPLNKKLIDGGISGDIKGRPKSIYSIWKKMGNQNIGVDDIFDKFAIRIILDNVNYEDEKVLCWKVYSMVTDKYTPNPGRLRDWISHPKVSGYESLHTTVEADGNHWIEIQIRTRRMDDIAEKGDAAHWRYKEISISESGTDWLDNMRKSLEHSNETDSGVVNKKEGTFPISNHIYIFTPGEDLHRLSIGSTVLDFAFHIHTNIGLTCTGAHVNGNFVPIKHVLKNGDIVEIVTSKKQKPSDQWLKIVTSSKIRSKVKRAIRKNERQFAEAGKEMLRQKFKTIDIPFSSENIDKVANYFDEKNVMDFFENVGLQKIDLLKIKKVFVKEEGEDCVDTPQKQHEQITEDDVHKSQRRRKHADCIIIDDTIQGVDYSMAPCCGPVMGDDIFCFVSVSKGMRVHKKNCPNAIDMWTHSPHRIIAAKWSDTGHAFLFTSHIKVSGSDERNILSTIVNTFKDISDSKMLSCKVNTSKTSFIIDLYIDVKDKNKINEILSKLTKIKGVVRAWRAG